MAPLASPVLLKTDEEAVMSIDPKDKEVLKQALMGLDDEQLKDVSDKLKKVRDQLDDLNSAFPETQKFLRSKGVTKVSELDEAGRQELMQHLREVLAKISN
jgi:hypothetical protein